MDLKEVRRRLFDLYAANLTRYRPAIRDLFVCPICRTSFDRNSLDEENSAPSVEHCIPRTLGGRFLTLTCTQCNNGAGTELDAHLVRRLQADDFLAGVGDRPMDVDFSVEGHRIRSSMTFRVGEKRSFHLRVIRRATDPAKLEAAVALLRSGREGIKGECSIDFGYNPRRARVALLRVAYLLMFRQYGYGYCMFQHAEVVRRQVLDFRENLIPDEAVFKIPGETAVPFVPLIVTEPAEFRCFVVPVKLVSHGNIHLFGVALPGFDVEPDQLYERLRTGAKVSDHIRMTFRMIDFHPRLLAHPEGPNPLDIWDEVMGNPPRTISWDEPSASTG
jgi:hypothetical protein